MLTLLLTLFGRHMQIFCTSSSCECVPKYASTVLLDISMWDSISFWQNNFIAWGLQKSYFKVCNGWKSWCEGFLKGNTGSVQQQPSSLSSVLPLETLIDLQMSAAFICNMLPLFTPSYWLLSVVSLWVLIDALIVWLYWHTFCLQLILLAMLLSDLILLALYAVP